MNIFRYKGYEGTAEFDLERDVCRGKILFIDDVVTYEAASPAELRVEFEAAVDDYIDTCSSLGREPQKPLKGQFNVRVPPELHKAASLRAVCDGSSLNDVVVRALDAYLSTQVCVSHDVKVTVEMPEESIRTIASSASTQPEWKTHVHH